MMWYATKYDDDSLGLKHHTEPNNGHDVKFIVENTQWTLCQHYFTLWSVLLYLFKITFRITLLILILEEIDTGNRFYKYQYKKSLKIPKEQSQSVYRRRTYNTMANRKSTKGQTAINKTYI
jgi:hypothetical protein